MLKNWAVCPELPKCVVDASKPNENLLCINETHEYGGLAAFATVEDACLAAAAPDLFRALKRAESEARNEMVRLELCKETDGPAYAMYKELQTVYAAALARALFGPA